MDASWGLIHHRSSFLFVDAENLPRKPRGVENLISPLLTHAGLFLCDVARSHCDNPLLDESKHALSSLLSSLCDVLVFI